MKHYFLFSLFVLLSTRLIAQSAYHGGVGGGYAKAVYSIPNAGIEAIVSNSLPEVFPNPLATNQSLYIDTHEPGILWSFQIVDVFGHIVYQSESLSNQKTSRFSWSAASINSGIYYLRIDSKRGLYTYKILMY